MKTLQSNFTTPEQSKRLMEIGVPADSADCYFDEFLRVFLLGGNYTHISTLYNSYHRDVIPCWSVGRLIEICLKCSTLKQRQVRFFCYGDRDEYSIIDYVSIVLESGIVANQMDFSKLED